MLRDLVWRGPDCFDPAPELRRQGSGGIFHGRKPKGTVRRTGEALTLREKALAAADEEAEVDASKLRAEILRLRSRLEDAEKERDRIARQLGGGHKEHRAVCECGNVFMAD